MSKDIVLNNVVQKTTIDNLFVSPDEGNLLSYFGTLPTKGMKILAVELYTKWYTFYEIDHNGKLEKSKLSTDTNNVGFMDHTWNPQDLVDYVDKHEDEYYLPELTLELLIGRWEIETKGNYL